MYSIVVAWTWVITEQGGKFLLEITTSLEMLISGGDGENHICCPKAFCQGITWF